MAGDITKSNKSMVCPVSAAAATNPSALALRDSHTAISYGRLDRRIGQALIALREHGLRPGDRIAIRALNSIDYVIVFFACLRMGASIMPLNLRWAPDVWRRIIKETGCKLLLSDESITTDMSIPNLHINGFVSESANLPDDGYPIRIDPNSEATLIFTSGSTGEAKGVVLSFANHYYNALGSNQNIVLSGEDCWLVCLPFYHVSGISILFRCFIAGASVLVSDGFDPDSIFNIITAGKASHVSVVPSMLGMLIDDAPEPAILNKLRCILLGGASARPSLLDDCHKLGLPLCLTYGMTEAGSQITATKPDDVPSRWQTSGACLPYRQIRIAHEDGSELPNNEIGEITIRGPSVFNGYLGEGKRNPDHWFRTGDRGLLDREGYLTFVGRMDDLILSGGEKIYPAEIENVVLNYPNIKDCRVLARPDETWGERPVLVVEPAQDGTFSRQNLYAYLNRHLSKLQLPDRTAILEKFPRTSSGKIDMERLRKELGRKDVNWHNE